MILKVTDNQYGRLT